MLSARFLNAARRNNQAIDHRVVPRTPGRRSSRYSACFPSRGRIPKRRPESYDFHPSIGNSPTRRKAGIITLVILTGLNAPRRLSPIPGNGKRFHPSSPPDLVNGRLPRAHVRRGRAQLREDLMTSSGGLQDDYASFVRLFARPTYGTLLHSAAMHISKNLGRDP